LLFLYFRKGGLFGFLGDYEARPFSLAERLLTEPRVVLFYVSLLLYPVSERFSIAHAFPVSTSVIHPFSTLPAILAIAGSLAFLIIRGRKNPLISFSFLFFFLNHLIESSVFALELVFEHRNYIPSMFFFVPVSVGLTRAIHSTAKRGMRHLFSAFTLLLITALGLSTFSRNFAWKDTKSLWIDALRKAPDQMRVHHNLGFSYQERGDLGKAIYHFEKALRSPEVHRKDEAFATLYHLGKAYSEKGDREKAKSCYLEAIRMKPDFSPSLVNLAVLFEEEGHLDTADRYIMEALKTDPGGGVTNLNTGIYLLTKGMPEAAVPHLNIAVKEKATKGKALLHLGAAYKWMGQRGRAYVHLKNCSELDPGNLTPRLHLAEIYVASGQQGKAREEARRIAEIIAHDPRILGQVADLISGKGRQGGTVFQGDILKPLILSAMTRQSEKMKDLGETLKKEMEK
jgi:Tfp pilus assembly protein PilF